MKVHLDCFPCFYRQAVIAARLGTKDAALQEALLTGVADEIKATDFSRSPAYSTTFLHRKIRQILGRDPFEEIKAEYNRIALGLYPELSARVRESADPLWTACRLAIAGNIIDFGIFTSVDIAGTIDRALHHPLTIDEYPLFKEALARHEDILYLLDNAGEIVFDRILIEALLEAGKRVAVVAKGSPVLNDATMEDAREAGLTGITEVIDNGSDCIGTILEMTSLGFNRAFAGARLVISKGQGNFETLWDTPPQLLAVPPEGDRRLFFLFQSKCDVVAAALGLARGSMLLLSAETLFKGL
ncbi:MAG: ARMT1-like domain-containing protein [Nitrospirota bacterium]